MSWSRRGVCDGIGRRHQRPKLGEVLVGLFGTRPSPLVPQQRVGAPSGIENARRRSLLGPSSCCAGSAGGLVPRRLCVAVYVLVTVPEELVQDLLRLLGPQLPGRPPLSSTGVGRGRFGGGAEQLRRRQLQRPWPRPCPPPPDRTVNTTRRPRSPRAGAASNGRICGGWCG